MDNETIKEALSYSLGSDMHEVQRNSRKREDGTYESRIKNQKMKNGIQHMALMKLILLIVHLKNYPLIGNMKIQKQEGLQQVLYMKKY